MNENKERSLISIVQDTYQDISSATMNKYLADNFSFPVIDLQCEKDKFDQFIEALNESEQFQEKPELYTFEISKTNTFHYVVGHDHEYAIIGSREINDIIQLSIYGKSVKEAEKVYKLFKKFEHYESDTFVDFYTSSLDGNNGVRDYLVTLKSKDFKDDYTDYYPFLNINEMFKQFTESNENILVISGEPGTGKTRAANLYIKWLIDNPNYAGKFFNNDNPYHEDIGLSTSFSVSYVKNEDVLSKDQFWENQLKVRPALIFLDDADFCLTSRTNEIQTSEDMNKNKFLSQLLSFSDGITKNKSKFIITTNIPVEDIDTAVLRKGRTFDVLQFRKMTINEALDVWKNRELDTENFWQYFDFENTSIKEQQTDKCVPACDLGSAINKEKIRLEKNETGCNQYLKENGISILNKLKPTTVGFI